ncbi:hypothetical protein [Methylobacterium sp. Leaf118]|uniref:hypothetical protein n=1 Tax=Methylobacterium sp. Leaf118 TaxID=2876562 RepID=UPI001E5FA9E5|nr:hypothetical protein [Methylobacterium sp. Leaf118]
MSATAPHTDAASWLLPGAVLAASLLGAALLNPGTAQPGGPVAALFPPWWGMTTSLNAAVTAGGAVLQVGAVPGLVVTQSPDPGFDGRLRAAGALFLFDPKGLGLCLPAGRRQP